MNSPAVQIHIPCLNTFSSLRVIFIFVICVSAPTVSLLPDTLGQVSGLDIRTMTTGLHYQQFLNYTVPTRPVSQGTITICNYGLKRVVTLGVAQKPAEVLITAH